MLSDKAEYLGINFARIFYVQAGSSLLNEISLNTAHIDAVIEFLKTLSPFIETIWLGPRFEPNIDPRRFVRAGCDVDQPFDSDHQFALRELEPGISLNLPPGTKVGGRLRDQRLAADEDSQPFASPYFWAGFVITGDGSLQCRLA